ncbi:hypothetical protein M0R45_037169 [Rubus argutus]|uniref:Cyclic nucleotide-binding domain-containing protein n=1 Tax=Rubus argutus TaxID=59490 RepID=A0AAW1VZV7_RUBAR
MVLRDDIKYYLKNVEKIDSWLEKNGLTEQDFKLKIMEELLGKRHESKEFVLDPNRILSILSDNLRGEILEILYSSLDRLKKVRLFQNMDDSKLKEISKKLQHQRYTKSTTIISEEGLLEKILFIVDGVASIRKKYCHTIWELSAGKFYGEELLCSLDNLPKATESVKATTVVEALFIKADDLKTVLHNVNLPKSNEITTSYEVNLLPMLKKVPKLKAKDEEVLKKISGVLKKKSYTKGLQIIKVNEPLDMMFFVTSGTVGVRSSSKTRQKLVKVGEHYGKELVDWALDMQKLVKVGEHYGKELVGWALETAPTPLSAGTATTNSNVDVRILKKTDLMKVFCDTGSLSPMDSEESEPLC